MILTTKLTEMIDNKIYSRSKPVRIQRFVDFKLWMTLVNRLDRDDLTVKLYPHPVKFDDGTTTRPNIFIGAVEKKIKEFPNLPQLIVEDQYSAAKMAKYAAAGIPKCWIVEAATKSVTVYVLAGDFYVSTVYQGGDAIPIGLGSLLAISVDKLFQTNYAQEFGVS